MCCSKQDEVKYDKTFFRNERIVYQSKAAVEATTSQFSASYVELLTPMHFVCVWQFS